MVEDKILELCKNILKSDGYVECFEVNCSDCPLRKGNHCYGTTATRIDGRKIAQQYINDHTKTKEFDWKAFRENKISVRCDTEEKAKDFIKKAYLNGCYWITGDSESTMWKGNCTKIIYDCCDGNGRLFWGDTYYSKKHNKPIINWEIKEEVMEKTFREVIADIKEGEVWETIDGDNLCKIYINELGCLEFEFEINHGETQLGVSLTKSKYKLQRKQYTFEEAFKAYEEGKEIESCVSEIKYIKKNSVDLYKDSSVDLWMPHKNAIHMNEIRDKWYINN